jgi:hypothetical protein
MRYVLAVFLVTVAVVSWQARAQEKADPKKATDPQKVADPRQAAEEKLTKFEYPGSKRDGENILGAIAQLVLVTPDPLDKVTAWYHKALGIDEGSIGGVANLPWPTGAKATEAKGQQQYAIFQDDIRAKKPDGNRTVRDGTTRHLVVRTPEHVVVVVINRAPADKETMISVVYLPPEGKK